MQKLLDMKQESSYAFLEGVERGKEVYVKMLRNQEDINHEISACFIKFSTSNLSIQPRFITFITLPGHWRWLTASEVGGRRVADSRGGYSRQSAAPLAHSLPFRT